MDNTIIQKIKFEMEEIDELINSASPVIEFCKIKEPDFVEKGGVALILHSFYNGIENILLIIIKDKDASLPSGTKWHKDLLNKAFEVTENRTQIFRNELKETLYDYLQFRHLVRHMYSYKLKWEVMKHLLFDIKTVWEKLKEDFNNFMENNKESDEGESEGATIV